MDWTAAFTESEDSGVIMLFATEQFIKCEKGWDSDQKCVARHWMVGGLDLHCVCRSRTLMGMLYSCSSLPESNQNRNHSKLKLKLQSSQMLIFCSAFKGGFTLYSSCLGHERVSQRTGFVCFLNWIFCSRGGWACLWFHIHFTFWFFFLEQWGHFGLQLAREDRANSGGYVWLCIIRMRLWEIKSCVLLPTVNI